MLGLSWEGLLACTDLRSAIFLSCQAPPPAEPLNTNSRQFDINELCTSTSIQPPRTRHHE
ncbi:hypothetical protein DAEQUDRAFT_721694 [Daedalea quercina L-15889]|uniref:Uncharacterized protein n=1 Tax=Daedalea quercina L-15889 TaxID=1314783 RepID=A0A165TLT8_9APHY|nr:hypothetical protein DAEQUDRAFT_721694 [Daedalea quercina L-15889]